MAADTPVLSHVSPALDPETYRVEGYNDDTRQFVDCVVNAFSNIYQTAGKAHEARRAADRNPGWTDEQRVLIVSKEIEGARQRAVTRLANAERDLRANIAHTEKLLSEPLTERAGLGSLNGEVRAFARGLDRAERTKLITEALANDDEMTLTAILGAQPFLSGLSQVDKDHYLRLFHEKKNPHLVRRLDVMNRVLEKLERNGPVVQLQFEKAIGAKPSVVANLNRLEGEAKAALAELKAERA